MKYQTDSDSRSPTDSASAALSHALIEALYKIVMAPEIWRRAYEQRMQLARVDTRTLRDAGISEAQRFIDINKPFR